MKLNCHVVGFDIGCHEALITVSWIFFVTSTTVVHIEFDIKKLEWLHDSRCQNQPPDGLM